MVTYEYDINRLIDFYFVSVEEVKTRGYPIKRVEEKSNKELLELAEEFITFLSNDKNRDNFTKNYDSLINTIKGLYDEFKQRELPPYSLEDLEWLFLIYSYNAFIDEDFLYPRDTISKDLRRFSTLLYHYYNFFVNPMRADEIMEYIGDKAFFLRLIDDFGKISESIVSYSLFIRLFGNSKEGLDTLLRIVKKKTENLYLPISDSRERKKEGNSELCLYILELLDTQIKAKMTPFEFMVKAKDQRFNWFPQAIRNRFINTIKKQNRQKKKEIQIDNSREELSDRDISPPEPVVFLTEPAKDQILTESAKEQLRAEYGEMGLRIIEAIYEKLKNNEKVTEEAIAEVVNCTPRTIRNYKKLFWSKPDLLWEIFY